MAFHVHLAKILHTVDTRNFTHLVLLLTLREMDLQRMFKEPLTAYRAAHFIRMRTAHPERSTSSRPWLSRLSALSSQPRWLSALSSKPSALSLGSQLSTLGSQPRWLSALSLGSRLCVATALSVKYLARRYTQMQTPGLLPDFFHWARALPVAYSVSTAYCAANATTVNQLSYVTGPDQGLL